MSIAYFTVIISIVTPFALEMSGSTFGAEFGMIAVAVGLGAVALNARRSDYDHYVLACSGFRWVLILVPLLMAGQLAPVWLSLAHPIWTSTHEALGGARFGMITADIGLTLNAFMVSLAAVLLVGVTIVVARDRRRAELVLFVLSGVAASASLALNLRRFAPGALSALPTDLAIVLAGFGVSLSLAILQLAIERAEVRQTVSRSMTVGLFGLVGLFINSHAVLLFSTTNGAIAAGLGLVLFLLIFLVRRMNMPQLAAVVLCAVTAVGAGMVVPFLLQQHTSNFMLLQFVPDMPAEGRIAQEGILADTRWFGAGAGTFPAIGRIYQSDAQTVLTAASTATAIFAGLGWIGLAVAAIAVALLLLRLFLGAFGRGRDSFFPAAAAACVVFALAESFFGSGLSHTTAIFCFATIAGLGLSQSVSRSARRGP